MGEVKLTPSQRKLVEVSMERLQETVLRAQLERDENLRVVIEEHGEDWPGCEIGYDRKQGLLKWSPREESNGKLDADGKPAEDGGRPARPD